MAPSSGTLWSFDFGNRRQVLVQGADQVADLPVQVAQVRVSERDLLLVFPNLAPPSIAQQHAIRQLLAEHGRGRGLAFVLDHATGYAALVGSDAELVDHFAAAMAVVQTCWGWDESSLFTIVVDEFEFAVGLEYDGNVWTAWPDPVSRGRALP